MAFDLWQILHPPKQDRVSLEVPKWVAPQQGWVKCNVDAAFLAENEARVQQGASCVTMKAGSWRHKLQRTTTAWML